MSASRLPADLDYRDGVLHFDAVRLDELAERASSPFFLISRHRLLENYQALAAGLAEGVPHSRIGSCAKTNTEPAVLSALAAAGSGVLVSCTGEAELAVRCGFPAAEIAYQQPVLTRDSVDRAIEIGVGFFHVSHLSHLRVLEEAAGAHARPLRISLRLRRPRSWTDVGPTSQWLSRFGLTSEDALSAMNGMHASRWLSLAGVNCYLGTQQRSVDAFHAASRMSVALAVRAAASGHRINEINLGGGLPSPSLRRNTLIGVPSRIIDRPVSSATTPVAAQLATAFRQEVERSRLSASPTLVIEPGRAIVGDAAILVTRVHYIQGKWVFLDASHNYLAESFVLFSRQILPVRLASDRPRRFLHFSGGTVNATDVIDMWRRVTALEPGDLVAICDAGAYSLSRATRYAGSIPPVYYISNGAVDP